jgi:hypothetical protein
MAAFCHFWRMTPPEFWALTVAEYSAMVDYMQQLAEQNQR